MSSVELAEQAYRHIDTIFMRAGGVDEIIKTPEKIPAGHIWGDINTPWRCIADAIYTLQVSGYPTVGFISAPVVPDASRHVTYIQIPPPSFPSKTTKKANSVADSIKLTRGEQILWNGKIVAATDLVTAIVQSRAEIPDKLMTFEADAEVKYGFVASVLNKIAASGFNELDFTDGRKHSSLPWPPEK